MSLHLLQMRSVPLPALVALVLHFAEDKVRLVQCWRQNFAEVRNLIENEDLNASFHNVSSHSRAFDKWKVLLHEGKQWKVPPIAKHDKAPRSRTLEKTPEIVSAVNIPPRVNGIKDILPHRVESAAAEGSGGHDMEELEVPESRSLMQRLSSASGAAAKRVAALHELLEHPLESPYSSYHAAYMVAFFFTGLLLGWFCCCLLIPAPGSGGDASDSTGRGASPDGDFKSPLSGVRERTEKRSKMFKDKTARAHDRVTNFLRKVGQPEPLPVSPGQDAKPEAAGDNSEA
jgi:hypothetical protein